MAPNSNIYESDKLLAEYLLFHYGEPDEVLPHAAGPREALGFAIRCVSECVDVAKLPAKARALDLGCAVGRSAFELARFCDKVIGIDYSQRFVDAAMALRDRGSLDFARAEEGALATALTARVPVGIDARRLSFEQGDAMNPRADIGTFDVVLVANLIDRLREPRRCLARLPDLVKQGGQLVITSPYTWLEEFTPGANWLGGFEDAQGQRYSTFDGLRGALDEAFELVGRKDLPFLIREHARKYQWSVAEATIWRRRV